MRMSQLTADTRKKTTRANITDPATNFQKKVLNLPNAPLNNDEISVSKLGSSFTPTPPQNILDLEYDLYQFSQNLRLTYHFRNSNFQEVSLIRSN